MKKAVIILSEKFPAKHKKAGEETLFFKKLDSGEKIHTIRSNISWWTPKVKAIQDGEMYLSIRKWSGKPYNSLQKEHSKKFKAGMQQIIMYYNDYNKYPRVLIDGKEVSIQEIAKNDGLSVDDFVEWFFGDSKRGIFTGVVIHFTDFRY